MVHQISNDISGTKSTYIDKKSRLKYVDQRSHGTYVYLYELSCFIFIFRNELSNSNDLEIV